MIYATVNEKLLCDGCGKEFHTVYLAVMGDYFDRVWSYVFCTACIMNMHTNWVWMQENPARSMNVTVRGQNLNVNDMLIWGKPITVTNAHQFDIPDYAIAMS